MTRIESAIARLSSLDDLASRDSPVHRLDARVKVLVTAVFVGVVASFARGEVSRPLPLILFPVLLATLGQVPAVAIVGRVALAAPFAVMVGLFEPFLDRTVVGYLGAFPVTGGEAAFASILIKYSLCLSAALTLVATTGFDAVCGALGRFGLPRALVNQLSFTYRYLFVLADEAVRMVRAHALRSPDRPQPALRVAGSLLGLLLLRTLDRARRVHAAMLCRGFDGELRRLERARLRGRDVAFAAIWCGFFALARAHDLPRMVGALVTSGG